MFDGIKGTVIDSAKLNEKAGAVGQDTSGNFKDSKGYNDLLVPVATEKKAELSQSEMERQAALYPIVAEIKTRYQQAKDARQPVETQWLNNMLQWRGVFSAEELSSIRRAKERNVYASEMFIKITKTKVTAALGQILDLVFDNGTIPIAIEPTPVPEGAEDVVYLAPTSFPIDTQTPYGFAGDGKSVDPGATTKTMLGGLYDRFSKFMDSRKVIKGASPDPASMPTLTPAADSAQKMQKMILDQMGEENLERSIRYSAWECVVLGTGVMKGPMTYDRVVHTWEKDEEGKNVYNPRKTQVPRSQYVSCWNFYPDPLATTLEDAQYTVEKHLLNRNRLSNLKRYAAFDTDAIDRLLVRGPGSRAEETWETQIRDVNSTALDNRYEVFEYWGYLERDMLEPFIKYTKQSGLEEGTDQFQVNIWICDGEILRLIINPFVPQRIPYYAVPYEEHTQQIWGIAIPENMADAQILMNSHYRMMVDNLALAGNCIFEVNENFLSPGQDLTMYPGKVIKTNGGPPGQSIFALSFNNTAQSHVQAFQLAKQTADEVTGQPSYSYGGVSTTGANRTASGISMLMGAAAGNIRQVVKQFDEYLFRPLGEAYFNWNMQFNEDAEIHGDVNIVAGGTAALMRREVMSQRLLQLAQAVGQNPAIAPRINWDMWAKEFAKSLNLDPDKFVNDATAALLAAEIMGRAQGAPAQGQGGQAPAGGPGDSMDQTGGGGGTIAPSMASTPDESQSMAPPSVQ